MQASVTMRSSSVRVASQRTVRPRTALAPTPRAVPVNVLMTLAERTGTVDAPVEYAVVAGIVIALAGTAAVPIFLNSGQKAADKIFDSKAVTKTSVKKRK